MTIPIEQYSGAILERVEEAYQGRWTTMRRKVWRLSFPGSYRSRTFRTRREATEWCAEMGVHIEQLCVEDPAPARAEQ